MAENAECVESMSGELKALRESYSELRKENLHLKVCFKITFIKVICIKKKIMYPLQDQITRYRSSAAVKQVNEPYVPVLEKEIPTFYIAIAIAAAILGLLLGKYLL